MPYESQAQAGYFHTHEKELAKQGVDVAEWDRATKGKHLPQRAQVGGVADKNLALHTVFSSQPQVIPPERSPLSARNYQDSARGGARAQEGGSIPPGQSPGWELTTREMAHRVPGDVTPATLQRINSAGPDYSQFPKNPLPIQSATRYSVVDQGGGYPAQLTDPRAPGNYGYARDLGQNANWPKFEAEAPFSQNVEDDRQQEAHGGALSGVGRAEHAVRLAKRMAAGGFDPMGQPGASAMGQVFEGPIRTKGAGRTDVNKHDVAEGSYVIPADVVSITGDGNTEAGFGFFKDFFKPLDRRPLDLTGGMKATAGKPMKAAGIKKPGLNLSPMKGNIPHGGGKRAEGGVDDGSGPEGTVPIIDAGGEIVVPPRLLQIKFGSLDHGHNVMDEIALLSRKQEIERLKSAPPPKK